MTHRPYLIEKCSLTVQQKTKNPYLKSPTHRGFYVSLTGVYKYVGKEMEGVSIYGVIF